MGAGNMLKPALAQGQPAPGPQDVAEVVSDGGAGGPDTGDEQGGYGEGHRAHDQYRDGPAGARSVSRRAGRRGRRVHPAQ
jgi:hypothetical protein